MLKKLVCAMLALMMCLGACGALAETTLVPVWSHDTAMRFIYGGDYISFVDGDRVVVATPDGAPMTDAEYRLFHSCRFGYLLMGREIDGVYRMGVVNGDGVEIVPCQYDFVNVLSDSWAFGMRGIATDNEDEWEFTSQTSPDRMAIDSVDLYRLPGGALVATIPSEHILDMKAYGRTLNILDRETGITTCYDGGFNPLGQVEDVSVDGFSPKYSVISENGLEGLAAPDGTVVLEPSYARVDYDVVNGYFRVSDGTHQGLADLTGALVVPIAYDGLVDCFKGHTTWETTYGCVAFGYACVVKDDKVGYYRLGVGETCPPEHAYDDVTNYGVSATWQDADGVTHILAADGVDTAMTDYTVVREMEFTLGRYYAAVKDQTAFLVDWHGNVVKTFDTPRFDFSASGRYIAVQEPGEDACFTVYEVVDDFSDDVPAPEAVEVPVAEAPEADDTAMPDDAPAQINSLFAGSLRDVFKADSDDGDAGIEEAPAEAESEDAADAGDNSAAKALIESARLLMASDPDTARLLMQNALTLIDGDARTLLDNTMKMMNTAHPDAIDALLGKVLEAMG